MKQLDFSISPETKQKILDNAIDDPADSRRKPTCCGLNGCNGEGWMEILDKHRTLENECQTFNLKRCPNWTMNHIRTLFNGDTPYRFMWLIATRNQTAILDKYKEIFAEIDSPNPFILVALGGNGRGKTEGARSLCLELYHRKKKYTYVLWSTIMSIVMEGIDGNDKLSDLWNQISQSSLVVIDEIFTGTKGEKHWPDILWKIIKLTYSKKKLILISNDDKKQFFQHMNLCQTQDRIHPNNPDVQFVLEPINQSFRRSNQ